MTKIQQSRKQRADNLFETQMQQTSQKERWQLEKQEDIQDRKASKLVIKQKKP